MEGNGDTSRGVSSAKTNANLGGGDPGRGGAVPPFKMRRIPKLPVRKRLASSSDGEEDAPSTLPNNSPLERRKDKHRSWWFDEEKSAAPRRIEESRRQRNRQYQGYHLPRDLKVKLEDDAAEMRFLRIRVRKQREEIQELDKERASSEVRHEREVEERVEKVLEEARMRLRVDFGEFRRRILAGVEKRWEEIKGEVLKDQENQATKIDQLEREKEKLLEEAALHDQQVKRNNSLIQQLQDQLHQLIQLQLQHEQTLAEKSRLEGKIAELEKTAEETEKKLLEQNSDCDNLRSTAREQSAKIKDLEILCSAKEDEIKTLKQNNKAREERKEKESARLKEEMEEKLKRLEKSVKELGESERNLEESVKTLEAEVEEKSWTIGGQREQIRKKEAEAERAEAKTQELKSALEERGAEIRRKREEVRRLRSEARDSAEKFKQLRDALEVCKDSPMIFPPFLVLSHVFCVFFLLSMIFFRCLTKPLKRVKTLLQHWPILFFFTRS